ncbi:hypothetical protein SAMN04488590_2102 [Microbacterium sp. 77mftsu3.1]|nr:hypothetical protein SAMN04488590_2102 [Microbacterium sp. 77mftsu3.1]
MTRSLPLPKVERTIVAEGSYSVVEGAVDADGVHPVVELLHLLGQNMWPNPNVEELPDEYQTNQRSRLIALLELLAEGEDLPPRSVNYLTDGIWELVVNDLRVTFYGTEGDGLLDLKEPPPRGFWTNASFEGDYASRIRVGHFFAKTGQKTLESEIQTAIRIRDEDLAHDRD